MVHILHLHSSFQPGEQQLRSAKLINAFGDKARHSIVSGEPGALGAASALDDHIDTSFPSDFPSLTGRPLPGRLMRLAQAMKPFDLVLTYNWGAMDAVMAHTVFGVHFGLPPLVHHEDGFNEDEAIELKWTRNWYRRIALARASGLIVPSRRLESIALDVWQQPSSRVRRIANGIDTAAFAVVPKPDALPRIVKRKNEKWLGTVAELGRVKSLSCLVRTFAGLPEPWQLVIIGEGEERENVREEAMRLDIGHRVHSPGRVAEPTKIMGLFDLFALSSDGEQFAEPVVEAMAAGLAIVSPDVGDVADLVAAENREFVVPAGDASELAGAIRRLALDDALRRAIGKANQRRAVSEYDQKQMVDACRLAYSQAMGRGAFP